jgi:hypothetical protein
MFAVRWEVLEQLLSDPEWTRRFDKAKTTEEIEKVVKAFLKERGAK